MSMKNLEAADVREAVARSGGWFPIFRSLAHKELGSAMDRLGKHGPCPVHGGHDGFRFYKDAGHSGGGVCNSCGPQADGFRMLMWLRGWTFPQALEAVAKVIGCEPSVSDAPATMPRKAVPVAQPPASSQRDNKLRARLNLMWEEGVGLADDRAEPARRYLRRRGLSEYLWANAPGVIRLHPSLAYFDDDGHLVGRFPAIMARVLDGQGRPMTIHRTYLTEAGEKAPVEEPRKVMPAPSDRAWAGIFVPVGRPAAGTIGISEGLETALAVTMGSGMPCWASLSWTFMRGFVPPSGVNQVVIWADLDAKGVGQRYAAETQQALMQRGVACQVRLPNLPIPTGAKGVDWNDVFNREGVAGFQTASVVRRLSVVG
ncbi:MAG: toprim domain-containing protein [Alphaproteobacteria bacterium]|nr:toprim domain-containing protein [Alphaproteobacteria bacterium]